MSLDGGSRDLLLDSHRYLPKRFTFEQRLLDLDDGRLLGLGARQELEQLGAAARLQH